MFRREPAEEDPMTVVVSQSIFDEGKAAKAAGKPYTDDPYPAGSQDSADWLAGFTADEEEPGTAEEEVEGDTFVMKDSSAS
jgi:hypothetical protein